MSAAGYPYLVVRLGACAYKREKIDIGIGPAEVVIAPNKSRVRHPEPFDAEGAITPDCRKLMVDSVQQEVRRRWFRMCIVWAPDACSYCEHHSIEESDKPPSGGIPVN